MNLFIVTVTYGQRLHLLTQVLDAARAQGVARAIVVDNGSKAPVRESLAARYGSWAQPHCLGANMGSAAGFKAGMQQATASGAELILLLDDDNLLQPNAVSELRGKWQNLAACGSAFDKFAVHARRRKPGATGPWADKYAAPRPGSFLGFHAAEIPGKLARRCLPAALLRQREAAGTAEMRVAPYGGMLFHRDLLARIGLPDEGYFLYADDYEFSSRITAQGGRIYLVRDAVISDLDTKSSTSAGSFLFTQRLEAANLGNLYYAVRNLTYFERQAPSRRPGLMYAANKLMFLAILTLLAARPSRWPQYRVILRAIADGERGQRSRNAAFQV